MPYCLVPPAALFINALHLFHGHPASYDGLCHSPAMDASIPVRFPAFPTALGSQHPNSNTAPTSSLERR